VGESAKRILLVEGHTDTRIVSALLLRRAGYDVTAASTKEEAIKLCKEKPFSLLIGDTRLPDGSGYELMRELAEICDMKGIAFTGHGYEEEVAKARDAGFSAYLVKPVDWDELLRTVERVLAESISPKSS
jgi:DNA-binding response OmpR family regulator